METNNGPGAWDDLLRFNNGVGGQMNCQDGNSFYLKPRMVENVQTGNAHETQSVSSTATHRTVGFRITRCNGPRYNILINARGGWLDGGLHFLVKFSYKSLSLGHQGECIGQPVLTREKISLSCALDKAFFLTGWSSQVESNNRLNAWEHLYTYNKRD